MNPGDSLTAAKQRLSLSSLMAQLGLGDHAKSSAPCPFHEDSSPSFSVFLGDDGFEHWKCHAGCGAGDAIDFLAKARGMSNADACREFIVMAGMNRTTPTSPPPKPPPMPRFDWQTCVAAFTADDRQRLAEWRGYSPAFVQWLHAQNLVGLFQGKHIAFPVQNAQGTVIGCHYRLKEDGSWRYYPTGTRTAPLIVGNLAMARMVHAFESQWDFCAAADKLNWYESWPTDTAVIITRGAENGRLLQDRITGDAVVYAFRQNDKPNPATGVCPGDKWLSTIADYCGCRCLHVITPAAHKDLNDWTRAGATKPDIEAAMAAAQVVPPKSQGSGSTVPVENALGLPDEPDEPTVPPFPVSELPPVMADIIAAVSTTQNVPVTLPAVCAIGILSAALGAGLEVVSGPNRTTRGNLFLLASADSGSGKSETFRIIAAPLMDLQNQMIEIWKAKTDPQLKAEIRVLDKEIANLERKAAKASDPMDRDRLRGQLEYTIAKKSEVAARATMPSVIAQDVTTERLTVILQENKQVIFSVSADARKLIDNLLGRYNPGKTTDESLYLAAYSGDFVRVDRQSKEPVILTKPCLALCWLIQPDLLGTMLDEESLSASGFLPRLLLCHTNATPRRIEGEAQPLPASVFEAWTQLVNDLFANYHEAASPRQITATPEAMAILNKFHNNIVDRRNADLSDVGAFAARFAENAWRFAVVFHAARWAGEAGGEPLDADTAISAVKVMEWFMASALDILAKGRRAAANKVEDEVLELLESNRERKALDYVTARDVHRARVTTTAEAARALLARMEAAGVLTGRDIAPAHGGKPTKIFRHAKNRVSE